jgi:hypothetical protein
LKNGKARLTNLVGQIVMEQAIREGSNEIATGGLPAGAYELSIELGGETNRVKMVISK